MKRFLCFAGICCAMMATFAGCSKDGFKYGNISLSPDAITGMYRAEHNTCVQTDASGDVVKESSYENSPAWPGSYTVFYEFLENGKIVGYTRYLFKDNGTERCWYLRQTEEQSAKNVLNGDAQKRSVETNLWGSEVSRMIIYSSDENEVQLWLENPSIGKRWYDAYKLTKVTDAATIASLKENPMADTEENRDAVMSEIEKLLGRNRSCGFQ